MEAIRISKAMMRRLPVYLNYLKSLPGEDCNISATTIAKALDLGDVQVRKDLSKISHEGRRRTGRSRDQLIRDIEAHMDCSATAISVIVGAGKLGQALLDYDGFEESGMSVMAAFDIHPTTKQSATGKPIYPMNCLEAFCKCYDVRIGIIAVPGESAQAVCDCLVRCGVKAIWNFAPVHLNVAEDVVVQRENLAVSLTSLRLQMKNQEMQNL